MLKNKSYFKSSSGDEAGKTQKKGILTSKLTGKAYFQAWSMNVKFQKKNVCRHFDVMTCNHGSIPGNVPTWPYLDQQYMFSSDPCRRDESTVAFSCSGDHEKDCKNEDCRKAKNCMLVPHTPTGKQQGCCKSPPPKQTPHHLIEVHCFTEAGQRSSGVRVTGFDLYNDKKAPCVCVDGSRYKDQHGKMHAIQNTHEKNMMDSEGPRSQMGGKSNRWNYGEAKKAALHAHGKTFQNNDEAQCSKECLEKQIDSYHRQVGCKSDNTPLRADRSPLKDEQKEWGAAQLTGLG